MVDYDFIQRISKEKEYKDYIMDHIANVEEAYHRLIEPLRHKYSKEVDDAIDLCGQYIPLHDLSKLSKDEFDIYRKHFYPTDEEKKDKTSDEADWTAAKQHHYKSNPHHVYYWVNGDEKENMPLNFIFEMLCDWSAVSKHFALDHGDKNASVTSWYDNQAKKEKAAFTNTTRRTVDYWVDEIFRKPDIKF